MNEEKGLKSVLKYRDYYLKTRQEYGSKIIDYVSSDQFVFHVLKSIEENSSTIEEAFDNDKPNKDIWKSSIPSLVEYIDDDDSESYFMLEKSTIQHFIRIMLHKLSQYNLTVYLKPSNDVPYICIAVTRDLHQVRQLLKEVQIFHEIEEKEREAICDTVLQAFKSDAGQKYFYRYYIDRFFLNIRYLEPVDGDILKQKIDEGKGEEIPIGLHVAYLMNRQVLQQIYNKDRDVAWVRTPICYLVFNINPQAYRRLRMVEYNFWTEYILERAIPILEEQGYICRHEVKDGVIDKKCLEVRLPWEYIL